MACGNVDVLVKTVCFGGDGLATEAVVACGVVVGAGCPVGLTLGGRAKLMSPSSSALDAAEDGTMKMSSSALDAANEDVDESVVVGAGCGRGWDGENVFIGAGCSR